MKNIEPKDPSSMSRFAALRAAGIPEEEMERPLVAVLGARHPLLPGSKAVEEWVEAAALGVQSGGGNPLVFRLPGAASPAAFGEDYPWLSLAALAGQTERLARDLKPDALVLVADSEASLVAMLRGAARIDLPVVAIPGEGCWFEESFGGLLEAGWDYTQGKISRDDWQNGLEDAMGRAGFGTGAGQAGNFSFLAEALGLCLPGMAGLAPGCAAKKILARQSGWQAVTLAHTGTRLSHQLTSASLRNALAVDASLGGSASGVWALAQVAGEMGLSLNRPWLNPEKARSYLKAGPDGLPDLQAWRREGGITGLLLLLWEDGALDGSVRGVTRATLKEALEDCGLPPEPAAFWPHPGRAPERCLRLVSGPLAPRGVLFEVPANHPGGEWVARVFRGEAEACAYVSRHPKNEGEMLVLHNGGARAGLLASCLKSSGAGCWVLSDGEISGRCPNPKGLRLPCRPGMERALKEGGRVKIDFKAGTFEAEAETGEKAATPEWTAFDGLERERLAGFGFMGSEL